MRSFFPTGIFRDGGRTACPNRTQPPGASKPCADAWGIGVGVLGGGNSRVLPGGVATLPTRLFLSPGANGRPLAIRQSPGELTRLLLGGLAVPYLGAGGFLPLTVRQRAGNDKEATHMRCQLQGSEEYCKTGRGLCCASCRESKSCYKVCRNSPDRCGCAAVEPEVPASRVLPVPRPWEGGRRHGG